MRAAVVHEPHLVAVPVGQEILVHDSEPVKAPRLDGAGHRHGLPERAQVRSRRTARARKHEFLLLLQSHHDGALPWGADIRGFTEMVTTRSAAVSWFAGAASAAPAHRSSWSRSN